MSEQLDSNSSNSGGSTAGNRVLMIVVALLALGFGFWLANSSNSNDSSNPGRIISIDGASVFSKARALPEFSLYDQYGKVFDLARLKGHWSFVFFGYTSCPDVCPTTLAMFRKVHELLAAQPDGLQQVQFILVSVDPDRDTPEVLKNYVSYFNEDFVGVSGKTEQLDRITRALGAVYLKIPGANKDEYDVDHSAHVFLLNPEGQQVAILPPPHKADVVVKALSLIRRM